MTGRNCEYSPDGAEGTRYFQPHDGRCDGMQNVRMSNSNVGGDVSSTSHSPSYNVYENMPSTEDVRTIARQMRTMPNYFAAMAAAATINVTYPHASLFEENEALRNPSVSSQEEEMPSFHRSKYGGDRSSQNSGASISSRTDLTQEEERGSPRLTSQTEKNPDIRDMVRTG